MLCEVYLGVKQNTRFVLQYPVIVEKKKKTIYRYRNK